MNTAEGQARGAQFAPAKEIDPDSPEFFDACQALVKQSTRRRTKVAHTPIVEMVELASPPAVSDEADKAALREARRREDHLHAQAQALQTELTHVKARYNEALAALETASQRAGEARVEYGNAMAAISERDAAINQMRQVISDQAGEIDDLQHRLLAAEEARLADASEFLATLDMYRS